VSDRRSPRYPGNLRAGKAQGPPPLSEEAVLSEEEVQRRVNLEGGGQLQPPPAAHRFRDRRPTEPSARPRATTSADDVHADRALAAGAGAASLTGAEADPLDYLRATLQAEASPYAATDAVPALEPVERDRAADDDRRRQLWRDSATILIGVVVALLVGQSIFPQPVAGPVGSPTPLPTGVAIGTFGPPVSIAPVATFGPIINPSLGIDATPTPIPVITMGPTPSPSPSPSPSPGPTASKKPTPKPTVKPTTRPPTPTPEVTLPPPTPSAQFTWSIDLLIVTFQNESTGIIVGETSWLWDFGDGTTGMARDPVPHTYAPGDYTVTLTMTTPVDTSQVSHSFTVPPP
jgi:hypothetical protein